MRSRIVAAVAVVVLVTASFAMAAGSKKIQQSGSVKGDSGASVQLVLIKSGGAPKSVKNFLFRHLRAKCEGTQTRLDRLKLKGAAKIDDSRKFEQAYDLGTSKVKVEGKAKSDGSRVKGSVKGTTLQVSGAGSCKVPGFDFVTKR